MTILSMSKPWGFQNSHEFIWLTTADNSQFVWIRGEWNCGLRETERASWTAKRLLASQNDSMSRSSLLISHITYSPRNIPSSTEFGEVSAILFFFFVENFTRFIILLRIFFAVVFECAVFSSFPDMTQVYAKACFICLVCYHSNCLLEENSINT
jgi:hypothetical protein